MTAFYLVYSSTRNLFGSNRIAADGIPDHAFNNAERIITWEHAIGTYHEESIQDWFLPHRTFLQFWNTYYGVAHFVVTLGVFIVLFVRRPQVFPQHRNTLAVTTALAIVGFALFPLMPPRLLDEPCPVQAPSGEVAFGGACIPSDLRGEDGFGFVDTLAEYGGPWSFDSDAMASISNQYAAMPSLHIGWSAWCVDRGVAAPAPAMEPDRLAAVSDRHAVLHRRHRQPLLDRRTRRTVRARHRHRRRLRPASLEHRTASTGERRSRPRCERAAAESWLMRSASSGSRVASDSAWCWNGSTSLPICAGSQRRSSPTWRARSATSSSTRSPRAADISVRTSAPSSCRSHCTGCSNRPPTRSCGTRVTRPTCTRSSPAAATGSMSCARPAACRATRAARRAPTTTSRTATPRRCSRTPTGWR